MDNRRAVFGFCATVLGMTIRYKLAPATRMLWRDADVVQFETGGHSVVVHGLSTRTARSLTGTGADEPDASCGAALARLAELGFVWPMPSSRDEPDGRAAAPGPFRAGELTALTTRLGPSAAEVLHARRTAAVVVHGNGRLGAAVASVLAAGGVGRVHFTTETDVKDHHPMPGGVAVDDRSQRLAAAARAAVRRAAPDTDVSRGHPPDEPELAVLAMDEPVGDDHRDALHAHRTPHLRVALHPGGALVGPLVLPGLTSCLRCADLHRCDRDDAWPRLAVQLTLTRRYGPASEVAVATMAAGLAAMQAFAFLDGEEPACLEGTLEIAPPDFRVRRRTWPMHPACGCCG